MKYPLLLLSVLILFSSTSKADENSSNRPVLSGDVEVGERYIPVDEDYTTQDFDNESSYRFTITKLQLKQKLSPQALVSVMYKSNDKNYRLDSDTDLNNITHTVTGYFNFKISDGLKLKLDGSYRKANFNLESSKDKNNTWNKGGITLDMKPHDFTVPFFMFDSKNDYQFGLSYKRLGYDHAPERDSRDTIVHVKWDREVAETFTFHSRARIFIRDYDLPSGGRKNSVRESVGVGFDYQF